MAMKETVGSLRAYFVLAGTVSVALHVFSLNVLAQEESLDSIGVFISVIGLGLGVALLYLAIRLKHLLVASPQQIKGVLITGAVIIAVSLLLQLLGDIQPASFVRAIIGWLITWYLYVNTTRLSKEAQSAPAAQNNESQDVSAD